MLIDRCFSEMLDPDRRVSEPSLPAGEHESAGTRHCTHERRVFARVAVEVDVSLGGDGRAFSGVSADISTSGIFVAAYLPLPVGSRVSLRFRLPTGQVIAAGVVRWTRGAVAGVIAGMGIEMTSMQDIDRSALQRFCAR